MKNEPKVEMLEIYMKRVYQPVKCAREKKKEAQNEWRVTKKKKLKTKWSSRKTKQDGKWLLRSVVQMPVKRCRDDFSGNEGRTQRALSRPRSNGHRYIYIRPWWWLGWKWVGTICWASPEYGRTSAMTSMIGKKCRNKRWKAVAYDLNLNWGRQVAGRP